MSRRASSPTNIPASPSGSAAWSRERMDPMVAGLLEGAAFLAARVQLKLKHEFPEFTSNLLEQLVPNYLAPTPSAMLVKIVPPFADPALRDGRRIARGAYLDATYRELDRNVACRYRLSRRHHAVAVRRHRRGIFHHRGAVAGAWPVRRSRRRRRDAAVADPSHRCAARGRTARRAGAEDAETAWFAGCRTDRASGLSGRRRGGCGRALRAAVRRLRRRVLPLSRRIRRSGHRSRRRPIAWCSPASTMPTRCCPATTESSAGSISCANTSCSRASSSASS